MRKIFLLLLLLAVFPLVSAIDIEIQDVAFYTATNTSIPLNFSITANTTAIDSCWYVVYNQTDYPLTSNVSIPCGFTNFSFPLLPTYQFNSLSEYILYVYANQSDGTSTNYGTLFWYDNYGQVPTVIQPKIGVANHTFTINVSSHQYYQAYGGSLSSCWYRVRNATTTIIQNTTLNCVNITSPSGYLSSTYANASQNNVSTDGTYYFDFFVNDSRGFVKNITSTFIVDTTNLLVNLNWPTDGLTRNQDGLATPYIGYFEVNVPSTAAHVQCTLWGNWSGGWHRAAGLSTFAAPFTSQVASNDTDGTYIYNFYCNNTDTGVGAWGPTNFTFTNDMVNPALTVSTIATNPGEQTVSLTNTVVDNTATVCRYTIYNDVGLIDGLNNNVLTTCNAAITPTVTHYGTFTFNFNVTDAAGNKNSSSQSFTTSAASGAGGGTTTTIVVGNLTWSILTETLSKSYEFQMIAGATRSKDILFFNKGGDPINLSLSCDGALCNYLVLTSYTLNLPVGENIATKISFDLNLPEDIKDGKYVTNVIAKDQLGGQQALTLTVTTGKSGIIFEFINRLGSSRTFADNFKVPYIVFGIITFMFIFALFNWVILKDITLGLSFSIIIAFLAFFASIILI